MELPFTITAREWTVLLVALLALIILLPLLRAFIWRMFRFDDRVSELLSQTKSSEVRTGKVVETLAPLLDEFPVDIRKPGTATVFIGQPVDFIHFDPESGVSFIEVKSGNAQLTTFQRAIRESIERGAVKWHEFRLDGRGVARGSSRERRVGRR